MGILYNTLNDRPLFPAQLDFGQGVSSNPLSVSARDPSEYAQSDEGLDEDYVPIGNRVVNFARNLRDEALHSRLKAGELSPEELRLRTEDRYTPQGRLESAKRSQGLMSLLVPLAGALAVSKGAKPEAITPLANFMSGQSQHIANLESNVAESQEIQRKRAEEERKRSVYSSAAEEMMGNIPEKYSYINPVLKATTQEDPKEAIKLLLQIMEPAGPGGSQGGFGGWQARSKDWETISAMPPGPEKDAAITGYLYKWSPSVGYGASPQAIEQAAKKSAASTEASTSARIGAESAGAETSARTEATISEAKSAAGVAGKYTAAAQGQYDVTGTEAASLGKAVMSVDALNTMADKMESGEVGFFDLTPAGKFTNPEARKMFQVIKEYYARPLSGAAINATEWKQFESEVLSKWDTFTPEQRRVAAERMRELARADVQAGALITKDDQWIGRIRGAGIPQFSSEEAARKAGYGKGDKVKILINGKYVTGTLD